MTAGFAGSILAIRAVRREWALQALSPTAWSWPDEPVVEDTEVQIFN
ncbi:hypothetical protein [Nannocystis pusilla]